MSRPGTGSRSQPGSQGGSRPQSSLRVQGQPITFTARLVLPGSHVPTLEAWVGQPIVHAHGRVRDERILYAGSRDGFSNQAFHENCDGFSPTLTLVLLHNGRLFGGFTAVPWSSISGPHPDPQAFLFSLSDGEDVDGGERPPCRLFQFQNKGYSVYHAKDRGPLFGVGAGADLGLNLDKDSLHKSRSNCGNTYAIPRVSASEPLVSSTYLAGRLDNWEIAEVVVYHCRELGSGTATPMTGESLAALCRSVPQVPPAPDFRLCFSPYCGIRYGLTQAVAGGGLASAAG
jgi:hypothetical protein